MNNTNTKALKHLSRLADLCEGMHFIVVNREDILSVKTGMNAINKLDKIEQIINQYNNEEFGTPIQKYIEEIEEVLNND